MKGIKKQLKEARTDYNEYTKRYKKNLRNYVVNYYLNKPADEIEEHIKDVVTHGCISGLVNDLIYYRDTNNFFDKYQDDIDELAYDLAREKGYDNYIDFIASLNHQGNVGDMKQLKNFMAWFGFEEVSRQLIDELGLEY